MRDKTYHIYLDSHERKLLIHSLVELKNQLIQQGRYTDCIDELTFKVINAPIKRMKIEYYYFIKHLCVLNAVIWRLYAIFDHAVDIPR